MPMFLKTSDIFEVLKATAQGYPRAEAMLRIPKNKTISSYVKRAQGRGNKQTKEAAFRTIMSGMADYLREYPAKPGYKQGLWNTCRDWVDRIAVYLEIREEYDFSEDAPQPMVRDTGIALVKALHDFRGKTKEELSEELGVSKKTIQTGLRALDPELQKGGDAPAPFRFAGQEMRIKVKCKPDERFGTRWYYTENRLHPVALQLNTMQVVNLLRALQEIDAGEEQEADNEVCRMTALEIWSQLSQSVRDHMQNAYQKKYPEFVEFLEELEDEVRNDLAVFRTEREMAPELGNRQQLETCAKVGTDRRCDLILRRNGEIEKYRNVYIEWEDERIYNAVPADPDAGADKVRFVLEDVKGLEII